MRSRRSERPFFLETKRVSFSGAEKVVYITLIQFFLVLSSTRVLLSYMIFPASPFRPLTEPAVASGPQELGSAVQGAEM